MVAPPSFPHPNPISRPESLGRNPAARARALLVAAVFTATMAAVMAPILGTAQAPDPPPTHTAGPWEPLDGSLAQGLRHPGDPDPTGLWLVEDETAVITIEECEAGLCGAIHWLDPEGEGEVYDVENPDEELRERPLCGLEILRDFERDPDDPGHWEDGEIYAPDDGRTYSAQVTVQGSDELEVRGYRGIALIGRSQTWTRVSSEDFPECDPPSEASSSG